MKVTNDNMIRLLQVFSPQHGIDDDEFYFCTFFDKTQKKTRHSCGTTACVAGWHALVNNPETVRYDNGYATEVDVERVALELGCSKEWYGVYESAVESLFYAAFVYAADGMDTVTRADVYRVFSWIAYFGWEEYLPTFSNWYDRPHSSCRFYPKLFPDQQRAVDKVVQAQLPIDFNPDMFKIVP